MLPSGPNGAVQEMPRLSGQAALRADWYNRSWSRPKTPCRLSPGNFYGNARPSRSAGRSTSPNKDVLPPMAINLRWHNRTLSCFNIPTFARHVLFTEPVRDALTSAIGAAALSWRNFSSFAGNSPEIPPRDHGKNQRLSWARLRQPTPLLPLRYAIVFKAYGVRWLQRIIAPIPLNLQGSNQSPALF